MPRERKAGKHSSLPASRRNFDVKGDDFKNFAVFDSATTAEVTFETVSKGPSPQIFKNAITIIGSGKLRAVTSVNVTIPNFSFSVFERSGPASVPAVNFEAYGGFFGIAEIDESQKLVSFSLKVSHVVISATFDESVIRIPGSPFVGQMSDVALMPEDLLQNPVTGGRPLSLDKVIPRRR